MTDKSNRPRKRPMSADAKSGNQFCLDQELRIKEALKGGFLITRGKVIKSPMPEWQKLVDIIKEIGAFFDNFRSLGLPHEDEVALRAAFLQAVSETVIDKTTVNPVGWGGDPYTPYPGNNLNRDPTSPRDTEPSKRVTCFYDDPMNRETILDKLLTFGIANAYYLLRHYTSGELLEAIGDFQRALDSHMRMQSRTAVFMSLLK